MASAGGVDRIRRDLVRAGGDSWRSKNPSDHLRREFRAFHADQTRRNRRELSTLLLYRRAPARRRIPDDAAARARRAGILYRRDLDRKTPRRDLPNQHAARGPAFFLDRKRQTRRL